MKTLINIISVLLCLLILSVLLFEQQVELYYEEWTIYIKVFSLPIAIAILAYWLFRFRNEIAEWLGLDKRWDQFIAQFKARYPEWDSKTYFRALGFTLLFFLALGFIWNFPALDTFERRFAIFTDGITRKYTERIRNKAELQESVGEYNTALGYFKYLQGYYKRKSLNERRIYTESDAYYNSKVNTLERKIKTSKFLFKRFLENDSYKKDRKGITLLIRAFRLNPGDKDILKVLRNYYKNLLLHSTKARNLLKRSWKNPGTNELNQKAISELGWFLFDHRLYDHLSANEIEAYIARKLQALEDPETGLEFLNANDNSWYLGELRLLLEGK